MAVTNQTRKTKYSLGSVANHICMHQTVIGQEFIAQMEELDIVPDHMVGCITPMFKMYTLGHDFTPNAVHAGGLRYHGMNPLVSELRHNKTISALSYNETQIFQAAITVARTEGITPVPESSHAIQIGRAHV